MKCKHCGKELFTRDTIYATENDEPICESCYNNYYSTCRLCGNVIEKDKGYCDDCINMIFRKPINPYSTKIKNIFKNRVGDNSKCLNDRYFGYEMEFSNIATASTRISFSKQYKDKLIYNKSDSSLSDGVEIVTIPMTKNNIIKLIDDMDFNTLCKLKRGVLTENAGVHIHVSRNTISPIDRLKLSLLFNCENSYVYRNFIYYLVGRIVYCKDLDSQKNIINDGYHRIGSVSLSHINDVHSISNHALAINFGNSNTVEFRLFKSSADKEQLKSYLEFVEKSLEFVERNPINMISIPNFITFLSLSVENGWLKERLKELKKNYEYIFNIEPVDYTLERVIKFIENIETNDIDYALGKLINIPNKYLDYNKKITGEDIDRLYREYRDYEGNKKISNAIEKLKEKCVKEILNK